MALTLKLAGKPQSGAAPLPPGEAVAFSPEEPQAAARTAPPPLIGQGRKILVADDNPVVLKAFELKLRSSGFEVVTTDNPIGVASLAAEAAAELIILDIHFASPSTVEWDGFSAMQWLRRFPETANVPVIFVSGVVDTGSHRERALKAGAVAFFPKPVRFQELLGTITKTLKLEMPAG